VSDNDRIYPQGNSSTALDRLADPAVGENWFEYPILVHPHHTDYSGVVWHGNYLTWMEEARVECLRTIGIDFASLVALGCDLPVVEMSLRYHRSLRMGERAIVKTRTVDADGVKINWEYEIRSVDDGILYLTGKVALVAVDRDKRKIMRRLPPQVEDALVKLRE
jgi:acyl-CoA thioester hydrolase